jgi:hypothetical protein
MAGKDLKYGWEEFFELKNHPGRKSSLLKEYLPLLS